MYSKFNVQGKLYSNYKLKHVRCAAVRGHNVVGMQSLWDRGGADDVGLGVGVTSAFVRDSSVRHVLSGCLCDRAECLEGDRRIFPARPAWNRGATFFMFFLLPALLYKCNLVYFFYCFLKF